MASVSAAHTAWDSDCCCADCCCESQRLPHWTFGLLLLLLARLAATSQKSQKNPDYKSWVFRNYDCWIMKSLPVSFTVGIQFVTADVTLFTFMPKVCDCSTAHRCQSEKCKIKHEPVTLIRCLCCGRGTGKNCMRGGEHYKNNMCVLIATSWKVRKALHS